MGEGLTASQLHQLYECISNERTGAVSPLFFFVKALQQQKSTQNVGCTYFSGLRLV